MLNQNLPNLKEEKNLWREGYRLVVGVDEAGRGPLAGPVVASAVVVTTAKIKNQRAKIKNILREVKDSKKLTAKKRKELYSILTKHPQIEWGIGRVGERVIDRINIFQATKLAMKRAVKNLTKKLKNLKTEEPKNGRTEEDKLDFLLIDGNCGINLLIPQKAIIKGDEKIFSISAASIIAKVVRDRMMKQYHKKYPQYDFVRHKGYPTDYHLAMLNQHGPCAIHRKTFGPVRERLQD